MSSGEKINTLERLVIDASRVNRYLAYPRKVPIWKVSFKLPQDCYINRGEDNSDIALEIENMEGFGIVPSLSKEEASRRLKILIPDFILKGEIFRI